MVQVAPFAGAWIEIIRLLHRWQEWLVSLRSPERGLKFVDKVICKFFIAVAPFVRALIEIGCTSVA